MFGKTMEKHHFFIFFFVFRPLERTKIQSSQAVFFLAPKSSRQPLRVERFWGWQVPISSNFHLKQKSNFHPKLFRFTVSKINITNHDDDDDDDDDGDDDDDDDDDDDEYYYWYCYWKEDDNHCEWIHHLLLFGMLPLAAVTSRIIYCMFSGSRDPYYYYCNYMI